MGSFKNKYPNIIALIASPNNNIDAFEDSTTLDVIIIKLYGMNDPSKAKITPIMTLSLVIIFSNRNNLKASGKGNKLTKISKMMLLKNVQIKTQDIETIEGMFFLIV
jgi:hypothetical protein